MKIIFKFWKNLNMIGVILFYGISYGVLIVGTALLFHLLDKCRDDDVDFETRWEDCGNED